MLHVNCSMCPPLKFVTFKAKKTIIFNSNCVLHAQKKGAVYLFFIDEIFFTINCFMKLRDSGVALMGKVIKPKKKFYLTS